MNYIEGAKKVSVVWKDPHCKSSFAGHQKRIGATL